VLCSYNADGEVTGRGGDTLAWDGRGRHTGGNFSGVTVSYGFDAAGFRKQRTAGGQTTRYLLGGVFETNDSGTVLLADVDGPAGDLAHYAGPPITASTVSFRYYDGHGNLAATADLNGARTGQTRYDPFGAPLETLPANTTAERFTGRWDKKHDTTSQLIEMGVRPYDPALGRFLAVDPVEGGSANNYDYCLQDPLNCYDLDGRWAFSRVPCMCAVGRLFAGGRVHGNSRSSTLPQHQYVIVRVEASGSRTLVKTGVSGGRIRLDGRSARAEQQVRVFSRDGNRYESHIVARASVRSDILRMEQQLVNRYFARHGRQPPRNVRPGAQR
jgi:RHS repeat-associated protein